MSLHCQCLRKLRQHLRTAHAAELQQLLHGTAPPALQLRGFPTDVDLPQLLQRDVLAMVLCRLAVLQDGEVYGGFVRDMLAGLHWSDVDLSFASEFAITKFKQTLPLYLEMLLGLHSHTVQLVLLHKSTSYPTKVYRHELRWQALVIPVDISFHGRMPRRPLPATLASGLSWTHAGVLWRPLDCDPSMPLVSVDEIAALLRDQRDVLRRPTLDEWERMSAGERRAAESYVHNKKAVLSQRGLIFVAETGMSLGEFEALTNGASSEASEASAATAHA